MCTYKSNKDAHIYKIIKYIHARYNYYEYAMKSLYSNQLVS